MKELFRALSAETLKLKRTLAFWMVAVAPLLILLLQFVVIWNMVWNLKRYPPGFKLWGSVPQNGLSLWGVFMLPLFITLETALLNGLEHGEKQWKHLFALPVARPTIYFAKLLTALGLVGLSMLILYGGILLNGFFWQWRVPLLSSPDPIPYLHILKQAAFVYLASWLILAFHTWISMRWPGFALSLGVGIGGTFFSLFAASAKQAEFYPWLLPLNVLSPERFTTALTMGIIGGVVVGIAGCWEVTRRNVT